MRATEEQVGAELRAILGDDGLRENEPLAAHTTFRIGGPARWLALPSSEEEARAVVLACRRLGWPWRVLGLGSNILAADEGLDEVIIKLADRFAVIEVAPEAPAEGAGRMEEVDNAKDVTYAGEGCAQGGRVTNALADEASAACAVSLASAEGAKGAAEPAEGAASVADAVDATGAAVAAGTVSMAGTADAAGIAEALAGVVERGSRAAAATAVVEGIATLKATIGEASALPGGAPSVSRETSGTGALAGSSTDLRPEGEAAYGRLVFAQAGATNAEVAEAACAAGLAGYEFASGIPGTVGGAAVMNAGAYGGEFADVAVSVRCLTPEGAVVDVLAADAAWGYRSSLMMERGYVVLGATLRLTCDDPAAIRARMNDLAQRRDEKQPLDMPSAGSTFKRPEGHFAGKLIQDAGLQGCAVGGAQVSTKHAGFVVNAGDATAADVRALIAQVQECVEARFGVRLEPEVRLWEPSI